MTISSVSSIASPASVSASRLKRQSKLDTTPNSLGHSSAVRFAGRDPWGSFDSSDSAEFNIRNYPYLKLRREDGADEDSLADLEEKAAVPSTPSDTASMRSQRSRKRDAVWSFLSGKKTPEPTPAMPFCAPHHSINQRRWSLQEQQPAKEASTMKRVGNWLLKPFNSKRNAQPPLPPQNLNWLLSLEDQGLESSLSMAPSSSHRDFFETPPSSNDRRTSL